MNITIKPLSVALTLLAFSHFANAETLECQNDFKSPGFHALVFGVADVHCRSFQNLQDYRVTILGVGPGIAFSYPFFDVACIGPSDGFYIGVGMSVGAMYGVNGGLYIGALGGACIVGGWSVEYGAKVQLGSMIVKNEDKRMNEQSHLGVNQTFALLSGQERTDANTGTQSLAFYYKERDLESAEVLKRVRISSAMVNGQPVYRTQMEKFQNNDDWITVAEATRMGVESLHGFLNSLNPFKGKVLLEQPGTEDWESTLRVFAQE